MWGANAANNRTLCGMGDTPPPTRVNTTQQLIDFRANMKLININSRNPKAFIVGSADAHNSEYPTEYDQRRQYISGFAGSAGTAVISENNAALWVDGRYYIEADEVLSCEWILMKSGLPDTPTIEEWINAEMGNSQGEFVGVDTNLISHTSFTEMDEKLQSKSNRPELKPVETNVNPVDVSWTVPKGRPAQPIKPVNNLKMTFAGKTWQSKIADLRKELTAKNAGAFAVTSLDEIAWLFNLRGSDISYNPFFLSYAIVEQARIRLYILNKDTRLVAQSADSEESDLTLQAHLATGGDGQCPGSGTNCVEVLDYEDGITEITALDSSKRVWVTYDANYAIYTGISNNFLVDKSPIAIAKSQKNSVERAGMERSYNRDSVALIKFLAFLEKEIADEKRWTEVTAAAELDERREALTYSKGLSFNTISAYGSNGAIVHYSPSNDTDKVITTDSLYLLDSGGLYLDGTTDVTRTMHYGTPTDYQKECYTRVLSSAINLAQLHWPENIYGRQIDAIARYELWEAGLVYRHGTGHGIGSYLSVHEGPGRIALTSSPSASDEPLTAYQYYSDEPGYYEDNSFGIRLETVVMVSPYSPAYTTAGVDFFEFKAVTLVPFEKNLIDYSRMTSKQVDWLNVYNAKIRADIVPLLSGDQLAIDWVNTRTNKISPGVTCSGAGETIYPTAVLLVSTVFTLFTAVNA